jgi:uncharacterized protein
MRHSLPDNSRRLFAAAAATGAVAALLPAASQAQSNASAPNKVVVQVSDSDPAKWNLVLNNVNNLQTDLGAETLDVEVVVFGPGIGMLKKDSVVGERVAAAIKHGVKVVACQNTMRGQKLVPADMLEVIGYVPAGVVEIMQKQQKGYAYLRP